MPDAEYLAYELAKAAPAEGEEVRLKMMSEHGESRWLNISPEQYRAIVAVLTTEDPTGLTLYKVQADDETLLVYAEDIFHAFRAARAMRPHAVVVSDTTPKEI